MSTPKCSECGKSELGNLKHEERNWDTEDGHPFDPLPVEEPQRAVARPDPLKTVRRMTPAEGGLEGVCPVVTCPRPKGHNGRHVGSPGKKVKTVTRPGKVARLAKKAAFRRAEVPKPDRVPTVLHLAREISALEAQLTEKLDALKELLA